jgi:hypothetical protein
LPVARDGLATARRLDAELAQAQRDEPVRFDTFAQRIATIGPLIDVLLPRVEKIAGEQQHALQGIAVAALTRQQERLGAYATQARFALAQLYDRGTDPAREADHANKP